MLSLESGALVSVIEDSSPDIQYSHCKVYMGSDIFVRIAFGYSAFKNEGRCDIGIWSKVNKKKLFRTIHRNRNMCFFLRVIDNTIIVRYVVLHQCINLKDPLPILKGEYCLDLAATTAIFLSLVFSVH